MKLPLLTASRAKAARSCLRLHKLRYLDGWTLVNPPETLRFGTLVHAGLEAWWLAVQAGAANLLAPALAAMRALGDADPFELARAEVLLTGYDARWGAAADDYDVLGVEVEFECALVNPLTRAESKTWRLAGKLDVVVRERATGRVLVIEHKTSSEDIGQGGEYWRRLRMDGQVSVYFEGARAIGHDVAGCLYDVLGKPGIKPLKATPPEARKYTKATKTEPSRLYAGQREHDETVDEFRARLLEALAEQPDRYYQRGEVSRLETERESSMVDVWQLAQQLREAERLGRAPRNPDACVRYGRTCEFFGVCTGETSLDDTTRFVRSANVNPELAGTASNTTREVAA